MSTGVPAASASSCAWHERSIVMNHHAASSTVRPTVSRPWFARMAALASPRAWAMRLPSSSVEHDAGVVVEHHVVAVERARVLGERIERAAQRRPRLAVHRVGVRGGHHVGAGGVDLRVDHERGRVHRPGALDDLAPVVHEQEVLHPDLLEVHAERVDPEVVEQLGVAGGDVAGRALVEAEVPEQPERGGEPLLAVPALVVHVGRTSGTRCGVRSDAMRADRSALVPVGPIGSARWTSRSPNPNATWSRSAATSPRRRSRRGRRWRGRRRAARPTSSGRWASSACSACSIPEEWGGIGMSTVGFVAAMEQIGLADQSVAAAWQAHVTIGSLPLLPVRQRRAARAVAAAAGRGPGARRLRPHRARRRLRRPRDHAPGPSAATAAG